MRLGLNHFRIWIDGQNSAGKTLLFVSLTDIYQPNQNYVIHGDGFVLEILDGPRPQLHLEQDLLIWVARLQLINKDIALRWLNSVTAYYANGNAFSCGIGPALQVGFGIHDVDAAEEPFKECPEQILRLIEREIPNDLKAELLFISFFDSYRWVWITGDDGEPSFEKCVEFAVEAAKMQLPSERVPFFGMLFELLRPKTSTKRLPIITGPLVIHKTTRNSPYQIKLTTSNLEANRQRRIETASTNCRTAIEKLINSRKTDGLLSGCGVAIYLTILLLFVLIVLAMLSGWCCYFLDQHSNWLRLVGPLRLSVATFLFGTAGLLAWHFFMYRTQIARKGWNAYELKYITGKLLVAIPNQQNVQIAPIWGVLGSILNVATATNCTVVQKQVEKTRSVLLPDFYRVRQWCCQDQPYSPTNTAPPLSWLREPRHDWKLTYIEVASLTLSITLFALWMFSIYYYWLT